MVHHIMKLQIIYSKVFIKIELFTSQKVKLNSFLVHILWGIFNIMQLKIPNAHRLDTFKVAFMLYNYTWGESAPPFSLLLLPWFNLHGVKEIHYSNNFYGLYTQKNARTKPDWTNLQPFHSIQITIRWTLKINVVMSWKCTSSFTVVSLCIPT